LLESPGSPEGLSQLENPMKLRTSAFGNGDPIPAKYSRDGDDMSPPLSWEEPPEETTEFALICDDPDAPQDEPWVHWLVYCIPGDRRNLPEGTAGGGFEGQNSWGDAAYGGPQPPRGDAPHHYHFKLFALDDTLSLGLGATRHDLQEAMEGHILDTAETVGTFQRQ
jgi:Raf kinase inhibitor-like YbhB/YbcL family protein